MATARMGEMVVSNAPTDELIARGLGSCIGLAIVDRRAGVAGLAHIVLPERHPGGDRGRFADTAVPQLVKRMRALPELQHIPIAAVSGYARESDRKEAIAAGFTVHFAKPISPAQMKEFVTKAGS